jgi:hypothetical protein
MASVGFIDVRIVEESAIKPEGKIGERLKGFNFVSRTISAFKLPSLEDRHSSRSHYYSLLISSY